MLAALALAFPLACGPATPPAAAGPARIEDFPGTFHGAEQLARVLMKPGGDLTISRALQPRPEDYAAVFTAPAADAIRAGSEAAWASARAIGAMDGQTELRLIAATSDELRAASEVFPGYEPVLGSLRPGFSWYRFKFIRPGETAGNQYDGLVHVNGHWALFPEPWRHMPASTLPSREECIKFADHFADLMSLGQEGPAAEITRDVAGKMKPDLLKDCMERGARSEIDCALAAKSMDEVEKCGK